MVNIFQAVQFRFTWFFQNIRYWLVKENEVWHLVEQWKLLSDPLYLPDLNQIYIYDCISAVAPPATLAWWTPWQCLELASSSTIPGTSHIPSRLATVPLPLIVTTIPHRNLHHSMYRSVVQPLMHGTTLASGNSFSLVSCDMRETVAPVSNSIWSGTPSTSIEKGWLGGGLLIRHMTHSSSWSSVSLSEASTQFVPPDCGLQTFSWNLVTLGGLPLDLYTQARWLFFWQWWQMASWKEQAGGSCPFFHYTCKVCTLQTHSCAGVTTAMIAMAAPLFPACFIAAVWLCLYSTSSMVLAKVDSAADAGHFCHEGHIPACLTRNRPK